jgi:hypothetical protein
VGPHLSSPLAPSVGRPALPHAICPRAICSNCEEGAGGIGIGVSQCVGTGRAARGRLVPAARVGNMGTGVRRSDSHGAGAICCSSCEEGAGNRGRTSIDVGAGEEGTGDLLQL